MKDDPKTTPLARLCDRAFHGEPGHPSTFILHPSIFVAPMMPTERNDQVTAAGTLSVAPIASLTRGMTSFAINSMERFVSAGSTQSIPA